MNRLNFYFDQVVQEQDLDLLQTYIEQAIHRVIVDWLSAGVMDGLALLETVPPSLSVRVQPGLAYDTSGRRIAVPSEQLVNLASYVPAAGQERWVSLVVRFRYNEYDQRQDGAGQLVWYHQDESFELIVRAGAAAAPGAAERPAPNQDDVLLADILLDANTAAVTQSMFDVRRRHLANRAALLGVGNGSVNLHRAIQQQVDTRGLEIVYDAQGRVQELREKDGATVLRTVTPVYDGADQDRVNAIQEVVAGRRVTSSFAYDANGRLVGISRSVEEVA